MGGERQLTETRRYRRPSSASTSTISFRPPQPLPACIFPESSNRWHAASTSARRDPPHIIGIPTHVYTDAKGFLLLFPLLSSILDAAAPPVLHHIFFISLAAPMHFFRLAGPGRVSEA